MKKLYYPICICIAVATFISIIVLGISQIQVKNQEYQICTQKSPVYYNSIDEYVSALQSKTDTRTVQEEQNPCAYLYVPSNIPSYVSLSKINTREESYVSLVFGDDEDINATFQYSQHFVDPNIAIPKLVQNNSTLYKELNVGGCTYYYALGAKHHFVYEYDDCCFIVEIPTEINVNGKSHEITVDEAVTYLDLDRMAL